MEQVETVKAFKIYFECNQCYQ